MSSLANLSIFLVAICILAVSSDTFVPYKFTGPTPEFYDISLNNFNTKNGLETTWTYAFEARPGFKLSMHFLTKLEGNVNLKIYDGDPANNDQLINISSIVGNPIFYSPAFKAPYITSTGEQMYVEITKLQTNTPDVKQDFQAIVTDHTNPEADGCIKDLAIGINDLTGSGSSAIVNVDMVGNNCINIIRVVDYNNSPLITSNLIYFEKGLDNTKVYKNLKIADENALVKTVQPFPIADRNVLIVRTGPAQVLASWNYLDASVTLTDMDTTRLGSVMTRDYLSFIPEYLQGPVTQDYIFSPGQLRSYAPSATATIAFSILKPLGNSQLLITATDQKGNVLSNFNVNGTLHLMFNVTGHSIRFHYTDGNIPYVNGLYATYQRILRVLLLRWLRSRKVLPKLRKHHKVVPKLHILKPCQGVRSSSG